MERDFEHTIGQISSLPREFTGSADFRPALEGTTVTYIRQPFTREPDFAVTSVNYKLEDLLARGGPPQ